MNPEICKIGPFTIYAYGLMLVAAFFIGATLASRQAKKENINPDAVLNLTFLAFVAGIVGARLFYVLENLNYYSKHVIEIVMLQHGGLSWFGGLILGSLSGIVYLRLKRLPVLRVIDLIAPFVALSQSVGRIGCFFNGCCFGKISEHGIYFPVHDLILIPAQVYSSLLLLFIFIALRFLQDRPHKEGVIFFSYLMLYSLKRFFIEFWRADNEIILLNLTLFQLLSAIVFFVSVLCLFFILKPEK